MSAPSVLLAADHAGYALKESVKSYLLAKGLEVRDFGTHSPESVDYPDFVHPLATELQHLQEAGQAVFGIAICGSGQGVCMTANHHHGVRAALAWNADVAALSRQHNDANVLCLPARFMAEQDAFAAVDTFLNTPFEGGRHQRRVEKIEEEAV